MKTIHFIFKTKRFDHTTAMELQQTHKYWVLYVCNITYRLLTIYWRTLSMCGVGLYCRAECCNRCDPHRAKCNWYRLSTQYRYIGRKLVVFNIPVKKRVFVALFLTTVCLLIFKDERVTFLCLRVCHEKGKQRTNMKFLDTLKKHLTAIDGWKRSITRTILSCKPVF